MLKINYFKEGVLKCDNVIGNKKNAIVKSSFEAYSMPEFESNNHEQSIRQSYFKIYNYVRMISNDYKLLTVSLLAFLFVNGFLGSIVVPIIMKELITKEFTPQLSFLSMYSILPNVQYFTEHTSDIIMLFNVILLKISNISKGQNEILSILLQSNFKDQIILDTVNIIDKQHKLEPPGCTVLNKSFATLIILLVSALGPITGISIKLLLIGNT